MAADIEIGSFFDLKDFSLKKLWEKAKYPWSPLYVIEEFLINLDYRTLPTFPSSIFLKNPEKIFIGKNTTIAPGVYIEGPCYIGNNCEIRHGAWVRPNTVICDRVVIGHAAEVKQSLIFPDARVPHFSYIGDSIIGRGVNIGAGVVCANCRLDKEKILLNIEGTSYPTNLKKLGAIIGDGSSIGCNTLLNPGTLVGKGSICFPSLTLYGWVPPHSIIKTNLQRSCRSCE